MVDTEKFFKQELYWFGGGNKKAKKVGINNPEIAR